MQKSNRTKNQWRRRNSGFAFVYVALGLSVFIGCAALAVDMSFLHYRKAQAQKAADAAALAGAYNANDPATAAAKAVDYARYNGYDNGKMTFGESDDKSVQVTGGGVPATGGIEYTVTVSRREPLFFAGVLKGFAGVRDRRVGATAVALAVTSGPLPVNITGPDDYGSSTGKMNLSLYGRDGDYQNGDAYSVQYLNSNLTPNPRYKPEGYDFQINIDDGYRTKNGNRLALQIFDPDTYNNGGDDAQNGLRVDEMRNGVVPGVTKTTVTRTQFTLYATDNNTPIATAIYGADSTTDMKWVTPDGFDIDLSQYPNLKTLRLNVKTLDGASENGFNLRAGPPGKTGEPGQGGNGTTDFDSANGTSITAMGRLPINFNDDGEVKVQLGTVSSDYAGRDLKISNFDTDVGSKSIVYEVSSLPGQKWTGTLSANGTWATDTITLPSNYTTGIWTATYVAGRQDTSVWEMSATGSNTNTIDDVYLVR